MYTHIVCIPDRNFWYILIHNFDIYSYIRVSCNFKAHCFRAYPLSEVLSWQGIAKHRPLCTIRSLLNCYTLPTNSRHEAWHNSCLALIYSRVIWKNSLYHVAELKFTAPFFLIRFPPYTLIAYPLPQGQSRCHHHPISTQPLFVFKSLLLKFLAYEANLPKLCAYGMS